MEGWVQAICERSQLHLSVHLSKDGHLSCGMDGEASVNECDNNHTISPCFSGSRVTHLSVTLRDGVCVLPCLPVCLCAPVCTGDSSVCLCKDGIKKCAHTNTHSG